MSRSITSLTSTRQLLERAKLLGGFTNPMADCSVECDFESDFDRLLLRRLADSYVDALHTLPEDQLPMIDISNECDIELMNDGVVRVELPATVVKIGGILLNGWDQEAKLTYDHRSILARRQSNHYSRGNCRNPVAVASGTRQLLLYSLPAWFHDASLRYLYATVMPDFDNDTLWPTTPELEKLISYETKY